MSPVSPSPAARPRLGERHEKIVADLEPIFLKEGFRRCTINELSARLKCSKRTLYEVAPSKQELVLVVMERWLERIRHLGWMGALQHEDPVKRLEAYLSPGVSESRRASRAFMEDVQSFRPALAMLESHQRERTNVLKDILQDGIHRGCFRALHVELVADVFLASVSRINEPKLLDAAKLTFSEAFEEFFQLILHGLIKDQAASPKK